MVLCAALAGCAAVPPAGETSGAGASGATEGQAARSVSAPAPEREVESASLPEPEAPGVDANPDRLKGLDRAGLAAILGKPSFQRVDGPASLLRYRDASCVLDLFLYVPPKGDQDAARVNHIEARDLEGAAMMPGDCFGVLLRARQRSAG